MLDAFLLGKKRISVSLDLGLTESDVTLDGDVFMLPGGARISMKDVKKIRDDIKVCYTLIDDIAMKVQFFSDETRKFYKLLPTGAKTPPTMEISGIRMHVTKLMDPLKDTENKIGQIEPIYGKVLDTCTGLGYTAIMCAEHGAEEVVTCEIDENSIHVAEHNPWSSQLFDNKRIRRLSGDVFNLIKKMKNYSFDRVIHDPPSFSLAGLLYSYKFYDQLFRVMKAPSKLYHYTGSPGSKKRGINLATNVAERLKKAGFSNVRPVHYGIACEKV